MTTTPPKPKQPGTQKVAVTQTLGAQLKSMVTPNLENWPWWAKGLALPVVATGALVVGAFKSGKYVVSEGVNSTRIPTSNSAAYAAMAKAQEDLAEMQGAIAGGFQSAMQHEDLVRSPADSLPAVLRTSLGLRILAQYDRRTGMPLFDEVTGPEKDQVFEHYFGAGFMPFETHKIPSVVPQWDDGISLRIKKGFGTNPTAALIAKLAKEHREEVDVNPSLQLSRNWTDAAWVEAKMREAPVYRFVGAPDLPTVGRFAEEMHLPPKIRKVLEMSRVVVHVRHELRRLEEAGVTLDPEWVGFSDAEKDERLMKFADVMADGVIYGSLGGKADGYAEVATGLYVGPGHAISNEGRETDVYADPTDSGKTTRGAIRDVTGRTAVLIDTTKHEPSVAAIQWLQYVIHGDPSADAQNLGTPTSDYVPDDSEIEHIKWSEMLAPQEINISHFLVSPKHVKTDLLQTEIDILAKGGVAWGRPRFEALFKASRAREGGEAHAGAGTWAMRETEFMLSTYLLVRAVFNLDKQFGLQVEVPVYEYSQPADELELPVIHDGDDGSKKRSENLLEGLLQVERALDEDPPGDNEGAPTSRLVVSDGKSGNFNTDVKSHIRAARILIENPELGPFHSQTGISLEALQEKLFAMGRRDLGNLLKAVRTEEVKGFQAYQPGDAESVEPRHREAGKREHRSVDANGVQQWRKARRSLFTGKSFTPTRMWRAALTITHGYESSPDSDFLLDQIGFDRASYALGDDEARKRFTIEATKAVYDWMEECLDRNIELTQALNDEIDSGAAVRRVPTFLPRGQRPSRIAVAEVKDQLDKILPDLKKAIREAQQVPGGAAHEFFGSQVDIAVLQASQAVLGEGRQAMNASWAIASGALVTSRTAKGANDPLSLVHLSDFDYAAGGLGGRAADHLAALKAKNGGRLPHPSVIFCADPQAADGGLARSLYHLPVGAITRNTGQQMPPEMAKILRIAGLPSRPMAVTAGSLQERTSGSGPAGELVRYLIGQRGALWNLSVTVMDGSETTLGYLGITAETINEGHMVHTTSRSVAPRSIAEVFMLPASGKRDAADPKSVLVDRDGKPLAGSGQVPVHIRHYPGRPNTPALTSWSTGPRYFDVFARRLPAAESDNRSFAVSMPEQTWWLKESMFTEGTLPWAAVGQEGKRGLSYDTPHMWMAGSRGTQRFDVVSRIGTVTLGAPIWPTPEDGGHKPSPYGLGREINAAEMTPEGHIKWRDPHDDVVIDRMVAVEEAQALAALEAAHMLRVVQAIENAANEIGLGSHRRTMVLQSGLPRTWARQAAHMQMEREQFYEDLGRSKLSDQDASVEVARFEASVEKVAVSVAQNMARAFGVPSARQVEQNGVRRDVDAWRTVGMAAWGFIKPPARELEIGTAQALAERERPALVSANPKTVVAAVRDRLDERSDRKLEEWDRTHTPRTAPTVDDIRTQFVAAPVINWDEMRDAWEAKRAALRNGHADSPAVSPSALPASPQQVNVGGSTSPHTRAGQVEDDQGELEAIQRLFRVDPRGEPGVVDLGKNKPSAAPGAPNEGTSEVKDKTHRPPTDGPSIGDQFGFGGPQ